MKRIILMLVILFATSLFVNCSTTRVSVDFDDQADFSQFKTFHFIPQKKLPSKAKQPMTIRDPLFVKKARGEIGAVLKNKGFDQVAAPADADFLVAFYAIARNKATVTPPSYHIGRFGRRWVTPGRVHHYKEGTLIIDIVNRAQKELVWRGTGTGVLDRANPAKNLLQAIEKVLAEFPPK
ncbi:DUF4136 domain-containing protein [candidate division KSB1 bacterium]|nr:DUF4136 domain-containing protein [candidate division KSB1 bacterium]